MQGKEFNIKLGCCCVYRTGEHVVLSAETAGSAAGFNNSETENVEVEKAPNQWRVMYINGIYLANPGREAVLYHQCYQCPCCSLVSEGRKKKKEFLI